MVKEGQLLWTPSPEFMRDSNLTRYLDWLREHRGKRFDAVSATSGPAARAAFSVNRTAMVLPSGDQPGVERKPFTCVSFRAEPAGPAASIT